MKTDDLERCLEDVLGGALGLSVFPVRRPSLGARIGPLRAGLGVGVPYLALFCGLPWLVQQVAPMDARAFWALFVLQLYGAFWSTWATVTTKLTSPVVEGIIQRDVIPNLAEASVKAIMADLTANYQTAALKRRAWEIAAASAALSGVLVCLDIMELTSRAMPSLELVLAVTWWSLGWSVLFATAAKVVMVGRFYSVFAAHLDESVGDLGPLSPSRSPLIVAMASVGQTMLLFWLGIAFSIAIAVPFGIRDWPHHKLIISGLMKVSLDPNLNRFVLTDVVVTSILSIGMGTAIFLGSESALRRAIRKVTNSTLREIEREVRALLQRLSSLNAEEMKRLVDLNTLHEEVAKTNAYRSFILSGLSLVLPLVGPITGLLSKTSPK